MSELGMHDEPRIGAGGYTLSALSDYVEAGRRPYNAEIEDDPDCERALTALERVSLVSKELLEAESEAAPAPSDLWLENLFRGIAIDARAGREIPIRSPSPDFDLSQSEGVVRELVRRAGDSVEGVLLGRCVLDGDVTLLGEPIRVAVTMTVLGPRPLQSLADRVRGVIADALREHTTLTVASVDITVTDVTTGEDR